MQVRSAVETGATGQVAVTPQKVGLEGDIKAELVLLQATGSVEKTVDVGGAEIKLKGTGSLNAGAIGGNVGGALEWDHGVFQARATAGASALFGARFSVGVSVDVTKLVNQFFRTPAPPPPPPSIPMAKCH